MRHKVVAVAASIASALGLYLFLRYRKQRQLLAQAEKEANERQALERNYIDKIFEFKLMEMNEKQKETAIELVSKLLPQSFYGHLLLFQTSAYITVPPKQGV